MVGPVRHGPETLLPSPTSPRGSLAGSLLLLTLAWLSACGPVEVRTVPGETTDAASSATAVALITGPSDVGHELLGTPAPSLDGVRWLDGEAHPLSEDLGKPVLIRWWTDTCPFCVNSAPALRGLAERFGDDLVIRAIYHEKPIGRTVSDFEVNTSADRLGLPFLLGRDDRWTALTRWWLGAGGRDYTSVSFLVDPEGRIVAIHTGAEFHGDEVAAEDCVRSPDLCRAEREALEKAIGELLHPGT